ncbi:MAG: hypothetical protein IT303_08755 [Dehalococcoidia bacterium]|nr:hypothetical protein [Dehalococcoidia bacterium]
MERQRWRMDWWGIAHRRGSWLLLAAFLPSLLYAGHWTLQLDIPGTDYYIGFAQRSDGHQHAGDHDAHCHGDPEGCTDSPPTISVPVATLAAAFATATAEIRTFAPPGDAAALIGADARGPDTPPPRGA